MNTSNGRPCNEPAARTWENKVLNALTITALAGAALAISCAPKLSPGVTKLVRSGATGLVMSTRTLPASFSPYCFTTSRTAEYGPRSEEHTSELQSLMRISYAVFCLKIKIKPYTTDDHAT